MVNVKQEKTPIAGERELNGRPVVRFAPSPNGYLHIGHAYSALRNYTFAQRHGGRFLVRIEDIDTVRARPKYEHAIFEDLAWLGLEWEQPVRRQSMHLDCYAKTLQRLTDANLLYPCFCSRNDIRAAITGEPDWRHDPDGSPLYPGTCRQLDASARQTLQAGGRPFALRLNMDMAVAQAHEKTRAPLAWCEYHEGDVPVIVTAHPEAWGDMILARRDIGTSYNIAAVTDDYLQGVTDIVRGEDLYAATAIHRLLQVLLGFDEPRYRHHLLLKDNKNHKLSKSASSLSLRSMREAGLTRDDVLHEIDQALYA